MFFVLFNFKTLESLARENKRKKKIYVAKFQQLNLPNQKLILKKLDPFLSLLLNIFYLFQSFPLRLTFISYKALLQLK